MYRFPRFVESETRPTLAGAIVPTSFPTPPYPNLSPYALGMGEFGAYGEGGKETHYELPLGLLNPLTVGSKRHSAINVGPLEETLKIFQR